MIVDDRVEVLVAAAFPDAEELTDRSWDDVMVSLVEQQPRSPLLR